MKPYTVSFLLAAMLIVTGAVVSPAGALAQPSDYNPQTRQAFVSSCVKAAGGQRAVCVCFYRELERTVPFWKFVRADRRAARGKPIPKSWQSIGRDCQRRHASAE